jgi:hypothetical protein
MANKVLKGTYEIPDRILNQLKIEIKNEGGGKNRRRLIGYVKSGQLTDREIAKLIYDYKYNKLGSEKETESMEPLIKWAEREIGGKIEHTERTKRSQKDIGLENKFKKTHFKWKDDIGQINTKNITSIPKPDTESMKMFESSPLNEEINRSRKLMGLTEMWQNKITVESWFEDLLNRLEQQPSTDQNNPDDIYYNIGYDTKLIYKPGIRKLLVNHFTWGVFKNFMNDEQTAEVIKDMFSKKYDVPVDSIKKMIMGDESTGMYEEKITIK